MISLDLTPWWEPKLTTFFIQNKGWRATREQLENVLIRKPITLAVSPFDKDNNCHFICFDIDVKGNLSLAQKYVKSLFELIDEVFDYKPLVSFSGGKGYHVWIFPNNIISGTVAHEIAKDLRDIAEIPPMNCELIPSSFENSRAVKWPGTLHHLTKKREVFVSISDLQNVNALDTDRILFELRDGKHRINANNLVYIG